MVAVQDHFCRRLDECNCSVGTARGVINWSYSELGQHPDISSILKCPSAETFTDASVRHGVCNQVVGRHQHQIKKCSPWPEREARSEHQLLASVSSLWFGRYCRLWYWCHQQGLLTQGCLTPIEWGHDSPEQTDHCLTLRKEDIWTAPRNGAVQEGRRQCWL